MTLKEFTAKWAARLKADSLKIFPSDFLNCPDSRNIALPGKALVIGEEFFGNYEIITTNGNSVYQAQNHDEAKYIIYANREKPLNLDIPTNHKEIKSANAEYEHYLDEIIRAIDADYRKEFQDSNSPAAVNEIFRVLNLIRY